MYNAMDGSFFYFPIVFYLLLIVIGSFFLLNLILAVIMQSFTELDMAKKVTLDDQEEDNDEKEEPKQTLDSLKTDEEFRSKENTEEKA